MIQQGTCYDQRGRSRMVPRSISSYNFFIFTPFGLILFLKWCKWVLFWYAEVSGIKSVSKYSSFLLTPFLTTSFWDHFTYGKTKTCMYSISVHLPKDTNVKIWTPQKTLLLFILPPCRFFLIAPLPSCPLSSFLPFQDIL